MTFREEMIFMGPKFQEFDLVWHKSMAEYVTVTRSGFCSANDGYLYLVARTFAQRIWVAENEIEAAICRNGCACA